MKGESMSQTPSHPVTMPMGAMTPADVWRIIRKRMWLIIACFVIVGLGGTAGIVAWYYYAPTYTASGLIEVEPGQAQQNAVLGPVSQDIIDVRIFTQYVQAQVSAVENPRILLAALDALGPKQTMFSGLGAVEELAEELNVTQIVDTPLIQVSLGGRNREQVQAVVNEVLTQYISQYKATRAQMDADRQQGLREKRDELKRQLDDLGRKLTAYRDEASVIVSDERGGEHMARLAGLVREEGRVLIELAEAASDWEQFQQLRKASEESGDLSPIMMAFPAIMEAMRSDRSLASMKEQRARLSQDLASLQQRLGPNHDSVKRLATAAQAAKNDLDARQSEILGQLFQQQAATLKSTYDRARAREAELRDAVAEARAAAVAAAKLAAEYRARETEYNNLQELLATVNDGLQRMSIATALAEANIRIAQAAALPLEPSEPRLLIYIPAVIMLSILLGMGLSLLVEFMDVRLRTPAEVARQTGVPLLASVPDLAEDERLSLDTNVATISQVVPQSLLAESFRQLRTGLLFSSDTPVRSLLVSSPGPGDGKTAVASNLAITAARGGSRVLLVDANFRRPSLAGVFDVPAGVGLSNVLVGLSTPEEAIHATSIENLDVLVAGAPPPSPGELLGSPRMREFMVDQMKAYDMVIVDGAPILVVADNALLAEIVDGVVLVFRAGENTRGMAQRSARQMHNLRARVLGAVLNRVRATKGGYFRESFQAYYDYSGTACPVEPMAKGAARTAARRQIPSTDILLDERDDEPKPPEA
jgi:capsular exopolysaccharide synthesis family protein